ncbi:hypothetical protein MMC20_007188 [Loxospora ochrophaea]|nr:hypothetical protein [Loxospora ochrophaea]
MSDAWFGWQLARDGDLEDGCYSQEAAALKDYIHSTTITPDAATRDIRLPVIGEPETIRKSQSIDILYRLWGPILDGFTGLPEHRFKIIQLLQAIQNLPTSATIGAQLVVADINGISLLWGMECICDALERADAVPDFEVPATKEWLEVAGDRVFEESDGEMTKCLRERDLWKQEEGRKQRWSFWKRRLQSMGESEVLTLETRDAANKAVQAMEAVSK